MGLTLVMPRPCPSVRTAIRQDCCGAAGARSVRRNIRSLSRDEPSTTFLIVRESLLQLMISLGWRKDSMFSMSSVVSNTFNFGFEDWDVLAFGSVTS